MARFIFCRNQNLETMPAVPVQLTSKQKTDHLAGPGWQISFDPDWVSVLSQDGIVLVLDGWLTGREDTTGRRLSLDALKCNWRDQSAVSRLLASLEGNFALLVHDQESGQTLVARDRFGVQPCYYAQTRFGDLIASHLPELRRIREVNASPRHSWVANFAGSHYRYIDNDRAASPFDNIAQVPGGHALWLGPDAMSARQVTWWEFEPWKHALGDRDSLDMDAVGEELSTLLEDSVRRHLSATDNPAFTLSGGMDSSSVLATAIALGLDPAIAYSTAYEDSTYDETDEIREFLAEKPVTWSPVYLDNNVDLIEEVGRLVSLHHEPVATSTWLSHAHICSVLGEKGHDGLIGGLGGDELNMGEYEYFPLFFNELRAQGEIERLEQEIAYWVKYHDHPVFRKSRDTAFTMMDRNIDPVTGHVRPDPARMNRYHHTVNASYFDLSAYIPVLDHVFDSAGKNRCMQDMQRETLPCCLRAQDRNGLAAGIRQLNPFLDSKLVEFMFALPFTGQTRDGVTKQYLRHAMRGRLPEATRTRIAKTGWNAPAHTWFNKDMIDQLMERLADSSLQSDGLYNMDMVRQIGVDHLEIVEKGLTRDNHMMFLWQSLNLVLWHDWQAGLETYTLFADQD